SPAGRSRLTGTEREADPPEQAAEPLAQLAGGRPVLHAIQFLPAARAWPAGSRLLQWVRLDTQAPPANLALLAKVNARWIHAAAWGRFDGAAFRGSPAVAAWFLWNLYPHIEGIVGFDRRGLDRAQPYIVDRAAE